MKVYFFAAEFTKNTGRTITWKVERAGVVTWWRWLKQVGQLSQPNHAAACVSCGCENALPLHS